MSQGKTEASKLQALGPWGLWAVTLLVAAVLLWKLNASREESAERALTAETAQQESIERLLASTHETEELVGTVARFERENAELVALKNQLSEDVQAHQEELDRLKTTFQSLETEMRQEIRDGEIELKQMGGRLQVDLVNKILFAPGEATITERGQRVLKKVAAVLVKVTDKKVQVSGHTDDSALGKKIIDRFPTNWELSVARATGVVRFLQEEGGVPGERLQAAGHSHYRPISSNATSKGRARNRRIEILLVPIVKKVR